MTIHHSGFGRHRKIARFAVLLLTVSLTGCAGFGQISPQLTSRPESNAPALPAAAQREHERILAAYGGAYDDPRLQALIQDTVSRLVAASDRPDLQYRVTLLNSPSVNAFALPSGQLYVTRGLAALANDRSELASVLSHEMAHVIAKHAAIRENQARRVALIEDVVNKLLTDPQSGALALAKSKMALASFSRQQEFEADAIGVKIAARAGFDPYGAERFLEAMGANSNLYRGTTTDEDPFTAEFLSSHPSTPDRVSNAIAQARQIGAPGIGERDRAAYLASIDGLAYGENPADGVVRGRRYLHPKLGFTFVAPAGFQLDNTAQAVIGMKEGKQALRLDTVQVPASEKLTDYLISGWIENVDKNSLRELTINGLKAATATAQGEEWFFRLYAVRFGSDVYRFVYAAKAKSAEADRAFRESASSFRRLTLSEINNVKPLHIQIVTVKAGETAQQLAARMTMVDHSLQRFLVLNGLAAGDKLQPGEQVKIVAE